MSTNGKRSVKTNNSSNNNDSSGIAPATDNIQNFEEAEGIDETSNEKKSLKDLPKADSGKGESLNIDNDTQRYKERKGSVGERGKSLKKDNSGKNDSSGIAPATDNIQNFEEAEGMDETSNEKKSLKDLPKADSGKGESLNIDNDTQRYRDKEGSVTEREKSLKKGDSGNVDDFPSIIEDEHTYFEQSGESDINGDRRNNQGSLKTYCDTAASTCLDRPATQINVGKEERRKKGISDHHSLSSSSMDQTTMCIPNGYRHPQALPTVALSNNESSRQVRSSQSPTYALASGLQANEIVINEPSLDPTSLLEESNHLTKELPSSSLVSTNILNQMTEELMNVRHINQYLMQVNKGLSVFV